MFKEKWIALYLALLLGIIFAYISYHHGIWIPAYLTVLLMVGMIILMLIINRDY